MKLYNSIGPNPKAVRMFAAEHDLTPELVEVDLVGGENRRAEFLKLNPMGQLPALELDDGTIVTEVVAICEYFDEISDRPSLIGDTPEQRAERRMWVRRIDLNICQPMADGFRFDEGLSLFKDRVLCIPEAAAGLKAKAREGLAWLDGAIAGKTFICGSDLTLADVLLYANLRFFQKNGQPGDESWTNIRAWQDRMSERPSASA